MGRRIRWLGVLMVVCLGLVVAQLVNIQLVKAKQLQSSPHNPRVQALAYTNPRGNIYAADGSVLATSVKTTEAQKQAGYSYKYVRQYPQGPLYSGITGYDSSLYYGASGIEQEYDSYLGPHQQAPQTLSQLLFREQIPTTTDDVTLTVQPSIQNEVEQALTTLPPGDKKDGAVVVIQPSTGDILAMYSNPAFDPNALVNPSLQSEKLAYFSYIQKDHEGFYPLRPLANRETFPPGSTMKVVTSTAAYNLKPALASFNYPVQRCQKFSDSNVLLCDQSGPCGGTMTQMLPFSCDPGYAELGVQLGVPIMTKQTELFGYNSVPAIDLPGTVESIFPSLAPNSQAFLGQSSIGQYNVQTTALQNAMVAAGVANNGVLMTPHLMSSIHDSQGALVTSYASKAESTVATQSAAQQVTALMESVTQPGGTAAGVAFPSYLCAAVKTGTAQTDPKTGLTDTWMIGFAPANHPQVAVAVVVPQQANSSDGAHVAGPIMKAVMTAAVPQSSVSQPCNVGPVPVSTFTGTGG